MHFLELKRKSVKHKFLLNFICECMLLSPNYRAIHFYTGWKRTEFKNSFIA